MQLRLALESDIDALIDHNRRHIKEPGFEGKLAHPFSPNHEFDWEKRMTDKLAAMKKSVTEEGWLRSFVLVDSDGTILGEANIKNIFSGALHRCQLGMGMEESVRGQGYGKRLLRMAIEWARDQDNLYWMDLSYFAFNLPAKKLYTSLGFVELFTYEDRIRVDGVSIDDVQMVLKLK